jgi:hypothetical protein
VDVGEGSKISDFSEGRSETSGNSLLVVKEADANRTSPDDTPTRVARVDHSESIFESVFRGSKGGTWGE